MPPRPCLRRPLGGGPPVRVFRSQEPIGLALSVSVAPWRIRRRPGSLVGYGILSHFGRTAASIEGDRRLVDHLTFETDSRQPQGVVADFAKDEV